MSGAREDPVEQLLAEQVRYYRARAPEYVQTALDDLPQSAGAAAEREIVSGLRALELRGEVLELACGPGTWTDQLLAHADTVTAVDASPEMLELAAQRIRDQRVRFVQADLFRWRPDRRYDVVFFAFWLSHVPLERFEAFWSTIDRALAPGGLVVFVDDRFRSERELIEGEQSSTIRRWLTDGTQYRAVKVAHTPAGLERRLNELGWAIEVTPLHGPFYMGVGSRRS